MVARRRFLAGVIAASAALYGCDETLRRDSTAAQNPFASAERVDRAESAWSGRVLERLNAGSYVYLKVARAGGLEVWVVTAEAIAPDAENVHVRALRRVNHFESKRLGRAFAPLFFGIVRKDRS
jgi:hypothetical protein